MKKLILFIICVFQFGFMYDGQARVLSLKIQGVLEGSGKESIILKIKKKSYAIPRKVIRSMSHDIVGQNTTLLLKSVKDWIELKPIQ